MSIEGDMVTYVLADATISAIIGAGMNPVFASHDPQAPYISYRRVNTDRLVTHSGAEKRATVQFVVTCWDKEYDDAIDLADKVRLRLDGKGKTTWGTTPVHFYRVIDETDNFEPSPELLEKQFFGRDLTVEIRFTET